MNKFDSPFKYTMNVTPSVFLYATKWQSYTLQFHGGEWADESLFSCSLNTPGGHENIKLQQSSQNGPNPNRR